MELSEIYQLVSKCDEIFPVNEWTIDGLKFWPYIRCVLLNEIFNGKCLPNSQISLKTSKFVVIKNIIKGFGKSLKISVMDRKNNQKLHGYYDGIILIRSLLRYFKNLDSKWFSPILDSFQYYLTNNQQKIISLEYDSAYVFKTPRYSHSKYVQNEYDFFKLKAKLNQKFSRKKIDYHLDQYLDFIKLLENNDIFFSMNTIKDVIYKYLHIRLMTNYYRKLIRKHHVKYGFVVSYYDAPSFPLILACFEENIPSIDIQHGVQGDYHLAYNWKNLPNTGYSLIPNFFWVWSQHEANTILNWSQSIQPYHNVFIGGNLWLELWKENSSEFQKYFSILREKIPPEKDFNILVTLQPIGNPKKIIDIVKMAPKNWFWWIRLHPQMYEEMADYKMLFKDIESDQFNIQVATELPLPALLSIADVHLTDSSTVLLEGEFFGLKTIFTDKSVFSLYPEQVDSRIAIFASNYEDVINKIEQVRKEEKNNPKKLSSMGNPLERVANFLEILRDFKKFD